MEERHPILLHCCCAPCSAAILEWMLANGWQPTLYYFNPNIFPEEEYLIRKNECTKYAAKLGIAIIDEAQFYEMIEMPGQAGHDGEGKNVMADPIGHLNDEPTLF